jgi:hypothetical protein
MFERSWSGRKRSLGLWYHKNIFKSIVDIVTNRLVKHGKVLYFIGYILNINTNVSSLKISSIIITMHINS